MCCWVNLRNYARRGNGTFPFFMKDVWGTHSGFDSLCWICDDQASVMKNAHSQKEPGSKIVMKTDMTLLGVD